jgi:hypothetical protein
VGGQNLSRQLVINYADAQAATNGNQQFGNVLVGESRSLNLTVTNTGDAGSKLTGSIGNSTESTITPTSGSQAFTNLGKNQSATRTFTFTPTRRGEKQTTINVSSNTKDGISNPKFTGIGVAPVNTVQPSSVDAGYVRIGSEKTLAVEVRNDGNGNLSRPAGQVQANDVSNLNGTVSLVGNSSDFNPKPGATGSFSLRDNVAKNLDIVYKPTTRGPQTNQLRFDFSNGSDDGTNQSQTRIASLAGFGVGPTYSSQLPPNSLYDFGKVNGGAFKILPFSISNITQDPTDVKELTGLSILQAFIEGDDADAFELLDFTPATVISKGGLLDLGLKFSSFGATRLKNAVLRIVTDEGAGYGQLGNTYSYNLQGFAQVPEPSTTGALFGLGSLGTILATLKKKRFRSQNL